jgi:dipeptidyl aminopeptidase/acylaminoacyl peptidase
LLGSPYLPENRAKYNAQSPASYFDKITTPTLIIQNAGDPNAAITQAYSLYHGLKDRGVKSRMVIYGIDGHGAADPFHQTNRHARTLSWINENCGSSRSGLANNVHSSTGSQ